MRHHRKHFSLEEARQALADVYPVLQKIIDLKAKIDELGFPVYQHQYFGGLGPNGHGPYPPELESLVKRIKQLEKEGIQVKGLEPILLDFPYIRDNDEEVYLCWHAGEPEIAYWHRIPDGFAGRQPIEHL